MSEEFEVTNSSGSLSWIETWIKALIQPSEASYEWIANDPSATLTKAYTWIFLSSSIGCITFVLLSSLLGTNSNIIGEGIFGWGFTILTCCIPFIAILPMLAIMVSSGLTQAIAKQLGGTGTYSKLVYSNAAYCAPILLIAYLLGIIPYVNYISIPLGFYAIYLNIITVKAVNKFGWGKAIFSCVLILLLMIVTVGVIIIAYYVIILAAMGDLPPSLR